jgi:hypothetical protein
MSAVVCVEPRVLPLDEWVMEVDLGPLLLGRKCPVCGGSGRVVCKECGSGHECDGCEGVGAWVDADAVEGWVHDFRRDYQLLGRRFGMSEGARLRVVEVLWQEAVRADYAAWEAWVGGSAV